MLGAQPAVFYWSSSSTSKKTCDKSNKTNSEASAHVKYIKTEIKGNDQVYSFSSDKKHFLVPSLKLNSWSKLISYYALCNLRLLLLASVILLLTGLLAEENKVDLHIFKWYYARRDTGECRPFRDATRFVTKTSKISSATLIF